MLGEEREIQICIFFRVLCGAELQNTCVQHVFPGQCGLDADLEGPASDAALRPIGCGS